MARISKTAQVEAQGAQVQPPLLLAAPEAFLSAQDLAALEVLDNESPAVVPVVEPVVEDTTVGETALEPVVEAPQLPLADILAQVTDADRATMLGHIAVTFDNRRAFETLHAAANTSIQEKLAAYEKKMALPGIAGLMIATNVDPNFVNREAVAGKRFNVYGIDKLNDLLHGLNSGHFKNAINLAVMRSMFKFRKAGMAFTGQAVLGAVSDKVKVDKAMAAVLVRHTVDAGTAPTQSSSTMNALSVLGVVTNLGSQKFPIWQLTDAPVTKKLEALLAA